MHAPANDTELITALHERGQRVTPQRLVIHRALRELDRHATADELLDAVEERLPNVSLPTVYSTLELFEQLGMVRRLGVSQGAVRYDPRPDQHDHMVGDRCGKIDDLDAGVELDGALVRAKRGRLAPQRPANPIS